MGFQLPNPPPGESGITPDGFASVIVKYNYRGFAKLPLGGNSDVTGFNGVGPGVSAGAAGTAPTSVTDPTRANPYANRDTAVANTNAGYADVAGAGSFQAFRINDGTFPIGFVFKIIGGISNQHQAGTGFFMGLGDQTSFAPVNNVIVSNLGLNMLGVALDAADANFQLLSRNNTGPQITKIDLGIPRAADTLFSIVIESEPFTALARVRVWNINSFVSPQLVYDDAPPTQPSAASLLGVLAFARQPAVAVGSTGVKMVRCISYITTPDALIPGW